MSNKQTTVAPAEQASKQVPTIDTPEYRKLVRAVWSRASMSNSRLSNEEAALIAHIDAHLAGQPAAPVAATEQAIPEGLADVISAKCAQVKAILGDPWGYRSTDAQRYARLRILGAAPGGSKQLAGGTVLCFQNLDDFVDTDIAAYPSRGEASAAPVTAEPVGHVVDIDRKAGQSTIDAAIELGTAVYLATPADAGAGLTDEVAQQVHHALALAMAICDAVPTRAHAISEDDPLRHIGRMVNYQESTGAHGYAVIRDAKEAFERELARLSTPGAPVTIRTWQERMGGAWAEMGSRAPTPKRTEQAMCAEIAELREVLASIHKSSAKAPAGMDEREAFIWNMGYEAGQSPAPVTAEPVAYLHQVVCGDGEPDQALSFAPDNFPLAGELGYRSISHQPLYTAPVSPQPAAQVPTDETDIAWGHDLQMRLLAASQDVAESEDARQVMAEAACLLAALTGHPTQPAAAHAAKEGGQQ